MHRRSGTSHLVALANRRSRAVPEPTRLSVEDASAARQALAQAHALDGAVLDRETPVLCFRAPSSWRRAPDLALDFLSWAWESEFGAVLSISAFAQKTGWLGRVLVLPTNAWFDRVARGRVTMALVADRTIQALTVDLRDYNADLDEQIACLKRHVPIFDNQRAAYWHVTAHQEMVVRALKRPVDALSMGWVERYRQTVVRIDDALAELTDGQRDRLASGAIRTGEPSLDEVLPLLGDAHAATPRLVSWMETLRSERAADFARFMGLGEQLHRAMHDVIGDHSELCSLPVWLLEAALLSPAATDEGKRLVWVSKTTGCTETLAIEPTRFPARTDPGEYWRRINTAIPWHWGVLVRGDEIHTDLTSESTQWPSMPRATDPDEANDAAEALLLEAAGSKRWTIPFGAEIELQVGPFSRVIAHEVADEIFFVLRTDTNEFAIASVELNPPGFSYSGDFALPSVDEARQVRAALYLLFSAVVRDFFVVEERETVFAHRARRLRGPRASTEAGPRIVYLPRVRYVAVANTARARSDLSLAHRRTHAVGAHLRRVRNPSPEQLTLARRYGFSVPSGHTFVRPHARGQAQVRDVVYRSRSALRALFEAPVGNEMPARGSAPPLPGEEAPWFKFERDVARLLETLGFSVSHVSASRNGDAGIDVVAQKGRDLDRVSWLVQCKRFAPHRPVGPNFVRELVGALVASPRGTRGMIVTTSRFTPDAIAAAEREQIRLMDGQEFEALLARAATS